MIYLVGLNHDLQHDGITSAAQRSREALLRSMSFEIKRNKILVVAEEANREFLDRYRATESTGQRAARLCGISHRFCDPDSEERKCLGIPKDAELALRLFGRSIYFEGQLDEEKRKYYPLREQFWYDRIKDVADEQILFVCGEYHVDSFQALLRGKGHKSKVLCKSWRTHS